MNFRVSWSTIGSVLFLLFIGNSVYNLIGIFQTPTCSKNEVCYVSYLSSKPDLDLFVYMSDNSRFGKSNLIQKVDNFDYRQQWIKEMNITISKNVRNNGSLFIHVVLIPSKRNQQNIVLNELIKSPAAVYLKKKITLKTIPASISFNLLNDNATKGHVMLTNHLMSKFMMVICTEEMSIPNTKFPPEIVRYIRIYGERQILPMVEQDIMQSRLRDLAEITPELKIMPFTLMINPISFGKFRFLLQIEQTLHQFVLLGFSEKDLDEVKGVFADTNLYLLIATIFVSSIHVFWATTFGKESVGSKVNTILRKFFSNQVAIE